MGSNPILRQSTGQNQGMAVLAAVGLSGPLMSCKLSPHRCVKHETQNWHRKDKAAGVRTTPFLCHMATRALRLHSQGC
jgi:hypothetical protein